MGSILVTENGALSVIRIGSVGLSTRDESKQGCCVCCNLWSCLGITGPNEGNELREYNFSRTVQVSISGITNDFSPFNCATSPSLNGTYILSSDDGGGGGNADLNNFHLSTASSCEILLWLDVSVHCANAIRFYFGINKSGNAAYMAVAISFNFGLNDKWATTIATDKDAARGLANDFCLGNPITLPRTNPFDDYTTGSTCTVTLL